jgi:hypothetical protein
MTHVPAMYKRSCGAAALEMIERLARISREHWTCFAKARPEQMWQVGLPDPALASGGRASRAPRSELRALSEPTRAEGVSRPRKLAHEANRDSREALSQ